MAKKIYALLVGINDYPSSVGKLSGCLNDVDHFNDYLESTFDKSSLDIKVLKDQAATRSNVISQFREHLGKATAKDAAVFHYCGHGARWASAPEFKEFYPDGFDEGLVCIDSRQDGGYDLADKELAALIAEIGQNNPHLAVILDCCHSGSGTRGVDAFLGMRSRVTHEVATPRPLESYLGGYYAGLANKKQNLSIPTAQHILLAACERTQLAQEAADRSGVFTTALIETLRKSGGNLNYADLFVRCRAAVRSRARDQEPQFEAMNGFPAMSGFLGTDASSKARRFSVVFKNGAWNAGCGAVHGVPTDAEKPVSLILYPLQDKSQPAGTATVRQVGAQESKIELQFESDRNAAYQAELASLPVPPLDVYCAAEPGLFGALQQALEADQSAGIALTGRVEKTRYELSLGNYNISFQQRETGVFIQGVSSAKESLAGDLQTLLPAIRQVVQWERSLALNNARCKLDTSLLEFYYSETTPDGKEHIYPPGDIILDFVGSKIRGKLKARNRTSQTLHLVLVYFSDAFGIHKLLNQPLQPGESTMTVWGDQKADYFWLNDGSNESLERFKLLVTTEPADDFLLLQEPLKLGIKHARPRGIGSIIENEDVPIPKTTYENEWFTKNLQFKLVRRLNQVGSKDAALADGQIVVKANAAVQANLSMVAPSPTGRGIGADFYQALEQQGLQLLNFSDTPGAGESVLELTGIQGMDALKENPIQIELKMKLLEGEGILPLLYDGQHAILVGNPQKDENGTTHLSIDHIPQVADQRRSLGGSLKLYFFKTYLKQDNLNQLRWVAYKEDGSYEYQKSNVANKVAAAKNILLLVHGIIGDTESIAKGVQTCGIDKQFDLVLTYDYENLSTPISETARLLKEQLAAAGLHEDDGKSLTFLVHSMGGLVSRWFIEQLGGNKIVDHLVMCGTPNNGSPFGKVQDAVKVISMLTTLSVNYIPSLVPYSGAVLFALNRSKQLTPTLEQMNPSSEFIKTLNSSPDPGIPYTILAGDTSQYDASHDPLFGKLLAKVGNSLAFDALFSMQPNDIAVGVESILGIGGTRATAPRRSNVACHHLNYFDSEAGTKALRELDWRKL